jgi:hypothetical protein
MLPVFRTESQDRMLKSAQNFAAGFFGIPYEGQYQQLVTIEDDGVRPLSLSPSLRPTCPNTRATTLTRSAVQQHARAVQDVP